jgi:hypothetical protein
VNTSIQKAQELIALLDGKGIAVTVKLVLKPSTSVPAELENQARELAPYLRYLLAKRALNGECETVANAPLPERCRWCGRDPRQPPAVAEQLRRLQQWQAIQPSLWQWTEAQLDYLARRLNQGDEIQQAFAESILVRRADGRLEEVFRTDG